MSIHASAPGKLALLGEYAVLAGAPALVAAIDRRAHTHIEPVSGDICTVEAPDVHPQGAAFTLSKSGRVVWQSCEKHGRFTLFTSVLERLARDYPTPGAFRIRLCTSGFFIAGSKLGLGSSAALTVALAAALLRHAGASDALEASPDRLARLLDMHADLQPGGSGLDVAASLSGGLIAYERVSPWPRVERLQWPPGLEMLCLWSGRSSSTQQFLRAVDSSRARNPHAYADHMAQMAAAARDGRDAALAGETMQLLDALDSYADALDAFGRACGVAIMSAEHARLRRLAGESGAVYKPSGAGGGDVGVAFADDAGRLIKLREAALRAGFAAVDLQLDPCGLICENQPS